MHGDVILVGKFVQMVVANYRLQCLVWTTDPKSTVHKPYRQFETIKSATVVLLVNGYSFPVANFQLVVMWLI